MVFYYQSITKYAADATEKDVGFRREDNNGRDDGGGEPYMIYMGKDKYENEDLIKYGWPEDVWFHVDDLSSAHVYLRMKPKMTLDSIPDTLLTECAALVKANSIQGCKVSGGHPW